MKLFFLGVVVGITIPFIFGFLHMMVVYFWGDWRTGDIFRRK